MAEDPPKHHEPDTDAEKAMIEASDDEVKVPDEAESEPANTEGSEAQGG